MIELNPVEADTAVRDIEALIANVERVIVGKRDVIMLVVSALLSRGHVLLEDRPGLGKTMLARALALSIDCEFRRIQCTPDLLPVDITGYVDPRKDTFVRGAVFANIVLADELNRGMPRTQSALLEAMGEGQVSVEGNTYRLPDPFMLIATQNPVEHAGVNDLPEAQLDRFQMLITPGYPEEAEELDILRTRLAADPIASLRPVISAERVRELVQMAARVTIDERLLRYIISVVRHTRGSEKLSLGASPRSALQVMGLARAFALVQGRIYVVPDDVKTLFSHCLPHRLMTKAIPDVMTSMTEWKIRVAEGLVDEVPFPDA